MRRKDNSLISLDKNWKERFENPPSNDYLRNQFQTVSNLERITQIAISIKETSQELTLNDEEQEVLKKFAYAMATFTDCDFACFLRIKDLNYITQLSGILLIFIGRTIFLFSKEIMDCFNANLDECFEELAYRQLVDNYKNIDCNEVLKSRVIDFLKIDSDIEEYRNKLKGEFDN